MLVLIRIQDAFIPLPLQSYGNLVSACFYMDMNCFGLARVVSSWLWVGSVAADSLGWVVADSFGWLGWLQVVSDGFGWFQMVSVGFDRFPVFSGYVFRIYETRKKFNYLIHTTSEKKITQ